MIIPALKDTKKGWEAQALIYIGISTISDISNREMFITSESSLKILFLYNFNFL